MFKFVAGFLIVILGWQVAHAVESHGVLMVVKGDVKVEVAKSKKTEKAKVGFKIFPGDGILTGKDSRAKLVMIDKNVINISPDSKFILEKYVYNPDEGKKDVSINVLYGKIRNTVNQKYDGEKNKFHVKTASAVAGVRGTDFVVQFNKTTKVAKVFTFKGKVEVGKGLDGMGRIANPVYVTPGQFTVASATSRPSLPVQANPMEMQAMNNQTDADKGDDKERSPANDRDKDNNKDGEKTDDNRNGEKNGNNRDGEKRGPDSVDGSMPPPISPDAGMAPPSMMDQMGDDMKVDLDRTIADAPVSSGPQLLPYMPTVCGTGTCLPPTVNPEYFNSNTKLIINITN